MLTTYHKFRPGLLHVVESTGDTKTEEIIRRASATKLVSENSCVNPIGSLGTETCIGTNSIIKLSGGGMRKLTGGAHKGKQEVEAKESKLRSRV